MGLCPAVHLQSETIFPTTDSKGSSWPKGCAQKGPRPLPRAGILRLTAAAPWLQLPMFLLPDSVLKFHESKSRAFRKLHSTHTIHSSMLHGLHVLSFFTPCAGSNWDHIFNSFALSCSGSHDLGASAHALWCMGLLRSSTMVRCDSAEGDLWALTTPGLQGCPLLRTLVFSYNLSP